MGLNKMNQIKEYRKKKRLTQVQLGEKLRVAQSTVAMWETGRSMPRTDLLPELACLLDTTIDDLFKRR